MGDHTKTWPLIDKTSIGTVNSYDMCYRYTSLRNTSISANKRTGKAYFRYLGHKHKKKDRTFPTSHRQDFDSGLNNQGKFISNFEMSPPYSMSI